MTINPPTGDERPLVHYGSPYLDEVQALKLEAQRAEYEGRDPVTEGFDQTVIDAVFNEDEADGTVNLEAQNEVQQGLYENALTNDNQPNGVSPDKEDVADDSDVEDSDVSVESNGKDDDGNPSFVINKD